MGNVIICAVAISNLVETSSSIVVIFINVERKLIISLKHSKGDLSYTKREYHES